MSNLNNVETYEILEASRPDEMANLTTLYDFLEDHEELKEFFSPEIQEHYNNAQYPAQNASDFLCDSEPLDISDVESYMEDINSQYTSEKSLNDAFDSYMEECCPDVTKENDTSYTGEHYSNYKDMLCDEGAIHKLQNDQYEY